MYFKIMYLEGQILSVIVTQYNMKDKLYQSNNYELNYFVSNYTKGTFHAKMGSIKDRNGMDLTETEDIKGGKNTQKNYTNKILMTQITTTV